MTVCIGSDTGHEYLWAFNKFLFEDLKTVTINPKYCAIF